MCQRIWLLVPTKHFSSSGELDLVVSLVIMEHLIHAKSSYFSYGVLYVMINYLIPKYMGDERG